MSLSLCAVDSSASQAAALSGSTQRNTNAASRLSHAGAVAQSCRCSQPIAAFSGARSLARAINCSAVGAAAGAAKLFVKLNAAAVATEFGVGSSQQAPAQLRCAKAGIYRPATLISCRAQWLPMRRPVATSPARESKTFNPCLTTVKPARGILNGSYDRCACRQPSALR